jgi:origin recognition complex subunit 5
MTQATRSEIVDDFIARLSADNPGFSNLILQIATLVSTHPPPFIYLNDPATPRITSSVVNSVLSHLSDPLSAPFMSYQQTRFARVNAVACFTPRLLYDTVLNSLANWHVNWDDGCVNWAPDGEKPTLNDNLASFLHGLKAIRAHLVKSNPIGGENGKGQISTVRMVVLIERAERLKESMPDLIVPLTRLAELVRFLSK